VNVIYMRIRELQGRFGISAYLGAVSFIRHLEVLAENGLQSYSSRG